MQHLLRRLGAFTLTSSVIITALSIAAPSGARASTATLDDFVQPIFVRTPLESTVSEVDGSNAIVGFGPTGDVIDAVMLTDRRLVVASPTEFSLLLPDGSLKGSIDEDTSDSDDGSAIDEGSSNSDDEASETPEPEKVDSGESAVESSSSGFPFTPILFTIIGLLLAAGLLLMQRRRARP